MAQRRGKERYGTWPPSAYFGAFGERNSQVLNKNDPSDQRLKEAFIKSLWDLLESPWNCRTIPY